MPVHTGLVCMFCGRGEDGVGVCGELRTSDRLCVHYFCAVR